MAALIALAVTVGVADSVNPSTVGPALYLATTTNAVRRLLAFTAGVFVVYLAGGIVLTLGPGQAILAVARRPSADTRSLVELAAGAALALVAAGLWLTRSRVAERLVATETKLHRMSFLLGAGIMGVELPTALPYFAVIAAVLGSGKGVLDQLVLLVIFNAAFITPLLAIAGTRQLIGDRESGLLERVRLQLDRHASVLIPALLLAIGLVLVTVGAIGIA